MSTMIQVRNVPEAMHRRLKARAAMEGVSMSRYVMSVIERALERPSRQEVLAAIRRQPPVTLDQSPAEVLRAARDGHGDPHYSPIGARLTSNDTRMSRSWTESGSSATT